MKVLFIDVTLFRNYCYSGKKTMEHATSENLVTKCYSVKTGTVTDIYKSLSMNSLDTISPEFEKRHLRQR